MRNTFNRITTAVCTTAMVAMLVGCAPSPHLKLTTQMMNLGAELPEEMVHVNLIGVVGFDETFVGNYGLPARGVLYLMGIEQATSSQPASPEYGYRVVRVNLRHLKGFLYKADGEVGFATGAMVPDHLPELKAWDLIEVRQTGSYDSMKNFAHTGEGNAVLRVLCRRSDPDYEACAEALPRIGKYRAQGYTGAPYLKSLKDFGFVFSPAYNDKGERIRALQQASAPH